MPRTFSAGEGDDAPDMQDVDATLSVILTALELHDKGDSTDATERAAFLLSGPITTEALEDVGNEDVDAAKRSSNTGPETTSALPSVRMRDSKLGVSRGGEKRMHKGRDVAGSASTQPTFVDTVMLPLYDDHARHWLLMVVDLRRRWFTVYDSLPPNWPDQQHKRAVLVTRAKVAASVPLMKVDTYTDIVGWPILNPSCPTQTKYNT
ncbi:hypothetical protein Cgig2_001266 [Carnegiea gigantea]|uniref:Ubiquitin-like protease family profile domain-containing protein n=1 Tax=Carnegiea gigantea TaxID=171969 RepID=A0A9Q1GX26_9CARY|nr:hypothetical protein Cgig2_001266 [Carnegiea gigantea]